MMSSSTDALEVTSAFTAHQTPTITVVRQPELRRGEWTRLGPGSLLGDEAAEQTLADVADQAHAAASAQGYSVGWAQGLRRAAEATQAAAAAQAEAGELDRGRHEAEHAAAVQALTNAADELHSALAAVTARVEVQATELAWALTQELVGREVQTVSGADVVRRVLALTPEGPIALVHLHPDHVGDPAVADLVTRGVRVVGDPGLGRADAVVEVEDHALDLRVESALARVRQVLA